MNNMNLEFSLEKILELENSGLKGKKYIDTDSESVILERRNVSCLIKPGKITVEKFSKIEEQITSTIFSCEKGQEIKKMTEILNKKN